jgi:peptidoglycan/LPS O-acetylase OafA/YrhL
LCFGSDMGVEAFGSMCFLSLLMAGPLLIRLGARAAGLGVLTAFVGACVGSLLAGTMDDLASTIPIGATVALFVGGLAGLLWRSPVRRSRLAAIGVVVAVLGIVGTLVLNGIAIADDRTLLRVSANPTIRLLLPVDAACVLLLCLMQPIQTITSSPRRPDDGLSGRDSKHVGP